MENSKYAEPKKAIAELLVAGKYEEAEKTYMGTEFESTLAYCAGEQGDSEFIETLIEHGYKVEIRAAFCGAIEYNHLELAKRMFDLLGYGPCYRFDRVLDRMGLSTIDWLIEIHSKGTSLERTLFCMLKEAISCANMPAIKLFVEKGGRNVWSFTLALDSRNYDIINFVWSLDSIPNGRSILEEVKNLQAVRYSCDESCILNAYEIDQSRVRLLNLRDYALMLCPNANTNGVYKKLEDLEKEFANIKLHA